MRVSGDPHPDSEAFGYADLTTLERALAERQTTSVEITESLLRRVEAIDADGPVIRSVLAVAPDAIEIARERDEERAGGTVRGPLHGIPVVVKDNIDTSGLASTAGSLALSIPPRRDAASVAALRRAGAIVIAKTNLSEWANFRSTRSSSGWSALGGQTRNPHATDRSPSGSSSGSATAVAAGLAPLAVGTETDGSILSPSAVCGIVGLKPTVGLVSRSGVVPISPSQDTPGPMARSVVDAATLLGVLSLPDPADPAHRLRPDGIPSDYTSFCRTSGLSGARIGVIRDGASGYHPPSDLVFEGALSAMRDAGATLFDPAPLPTAKELAESEDELDVLCFEFHEAVDRYLGARADEVGGGPRSLADVIAFNAAEAESELSLFGQEILERSLATGGLDDDKYKSARARCLEQSRQNGLDLALDHDGLDALVALTTGPAWLIDYVNGDSFLGAGYSIAAVAGYPSVTVPVGHVHGLPIGCAFLGRAWSEPVLLQLAAGLEGAISASLRPGFSPLGTLA